MKTNNYIDIVVKVLHIFEFDGDEDKYANEFVQTALIRALNKQLTNKKIKEEAIEQLKYGDYSFIKRTESDELEDICRTEIRNMIASFIKRIETHLDDSQKKEIKQLMIDNDLVGVYS